MKAGNAPVETLSRRRNIQQLSEITRRSSKLALAFDYYWSRLVCGASLEDYRQFGMHRLNHWGKKQFVTLKSKRSVRAQFNDPAYCGIFEDKAKFNLTFKDFINRDWLSVGRDTSDKEIMSFIESHSPAVLKPSDLMQGQGIKSVSAGEIGDLAAFCASARQDRVLIEEFIKQHPSLNAVNPSSVNTVRINTVLDRQGTVRFINAVLRCASEDRFVDNWSIGGIITEIDMESGVLASAGVDKDGKRYIRHPLTGHVLPGTQIPMWKDALRFIESAAAVVPQVRLVGWDLAVTENGFVLVEGNSNPHIAVYQHGGTGMRQIFEQYV